MRKCTKYCMILMILNRIEMRSKNCYGNILASIRLRKCSWFLFSFSMFIMHWDLHLPYLLAWYMQSSGQSLKWRKILLGPYRKTFPVVKSPFSSNKILVGNAFILPYCNNFDAWVNPKGSRTSTTCATSLLHNDCLPNTIASVCIRKKLLSHQHVLWWRWWSEKQSI